MIAGWPFQPLWNPCPNRQANTYRHNTTKFMNHFSMNQFSKFQITRPLLLLAALSVACACQAQPTNAKAGITPSVQPTSNTGQELSWPRQFEDNGIHVSIFQPQIEKWEGTDFETRSAVAVTPASSNAPTYGVFWMKARANVDKAARIVTLNDIAVTRANFPSAPNLQSAYLTLIRKDVPLVSKTIALDHLEAEYAISEAVKK